jgi:hypothetical protein
MSDDAIEGNAPFSFYTQNLGPVYAFPDVCALKHVNMDLGTPYARTK